MGTLVTVVIYRGLNDLAGPVWTQSHQGGRNMDADKVLAEIKKFAKDIAEGYPEDDWDVGYCAAGQLVVEEIDRLIKLSQGNTPTPDRQES